MSKRRVEWRSALSDNRYFVAKYSNRRLPVLVHRELDGEDVIVASFVEDYDAVRWANDNGGLRFFVNQDLTCEDTCKNVCLGLCGIHLLTSS